jgi:hypothetical protein
MIELLPGGKHANDPQPGFQSELLAYSLLEWTFWMTSQAAAFAPRVLRQHTLATSRAPWSAPRLLPGF